MGNRKRKTPFGRNLFTILCIVVLLIIVFSMVVLFTTINKNVYKPFYHKSTTVNEETGEIETFSSGEYVIDDVERISAKDFDDFGVIFKCTDYNDDSNVASYELRVYATEKTPEIYKGTSTYEYLTANVCLTAKHVEAIMYATSTTTLRMAHETTKTDSETKETVIDKTAEEVALASTSYRRTFSVNTIEFPAKTSGLLFNYTVKKPTIYLYLSYQVLVNGSVSTKAYVLEYDFDDILPEMGGISSEK